MTEPIVNGFSLTWVPRTPNLKTGDIPTAYVGSTIDECRRSCLGCALLEKTCYAWHGLAIASLTRIAARIVAGHDYSLEFALKKKHRDATCSRIGAMGDPARADPAEVLHSVEVLTREGLPPISYTHFWRDPWAQHLKGICLASCEWIEDAEEALGMGWTPALILPWDQLVEVGSRFEVGDGQGLVCPAQVKPGKITCNSCRLCWLGHPVWAAGKIIAIGFVDHSRAARRAARSDQRGRQLPLFGRSHRDVRPPKPSTSPNLLPDGPNGERRHACYCGAPIPYSGMGRPRRYCDDCRS